MNAIAALLLSIAALALFSGCAARRHPSVTTVPLERRLDGLQNQNDEHFKTMQESQKTVNEQLSRIEMEIKKDNAETSRELAAVGVKASDALARVAAVDKMGQDITRRLDRVESALAELNASLQSK